MNYHNKKFKGVENSANGEVEAETIFHYRQDGDIFWATYHGKNILWGTITGTVDKEGNLNFLYQHINNNKEFKTGRCNSSPEILKDGRIRMHETWEWTNGDFSKGTSVLEEV